MESSRGKRAADFTRTYTVDSGKVSPASSTSSVASENAGRLVFDTFEVAAHNVNELMQLVAMWEAEGRAKSEAEGESLGALYVNQKVENYLNKFFNRRKVFAEHFIGDGMSAQEEDVPVRDASSEYLEEQLRRYMENKDSLTPGSGLFSSVPMEHTALTSVFTGNDITDAASATTDPLSEIVEKEDFYSFRSTESYPTSEDYQEVDSTSQTIIATSSMSSRGSSQQAVHTDAHSVPSSPLGSTPEPTGEQGYLTPLQASLLAIKTAYFVETVSTTQSRSFLSVEDTSSLASCESTEEPYLDVESEDTDSNLSTLVDIDVMSENVIQATGLSPIVQTKIDSSSSFLTAEDLTMRIPASQIPQATPFHEDDDDVSFKLPKSESSDSALQALCSAAAEEYVSPFGARQEPSGLQEPLRTSVGSSEKRDLSVTSDNIDLNLPTPLLLADLDIVRGTTSYSPSEDTIVEYQFPREKSFTEKEADPQSSVTVQTNVFLAQSEQSMDMTPPSMMFAPPLSSDTSSIIVQSNVLQELSISEESPDSTLQTMTVPTPAISQQAECPDLGPIPSLSSTQEASGRQTPLTALQMSLFAVKVASSIETKSSNQARSFLSAENESPIFLPDPSAEPEPSVVSEESTSNIGVADIDVSPDNIITEAKDNIFPDIATSLTSKASQLPQLLSLTEKFEPSLMEDKEASTASSKKEAAASLSSTPLRDSIQNFVPIKLLKVEKTNTPETFTLGAQDFSQTSQAASLGEISQTASIHHVPVELPKREQFENTIPKASQVPLSMPIQRPEATPTLRVQDFSQAPQAASLSEISPSVSVCRVPVELPKREQFEDSTSQTPQVPPSMPIEHSAAISTLRGQDLSQIPQSSGQLGPSLALQSSSDSSQKPEQASFTEEDLTAELERFRKQYGLVPKKDSSDLMTEEVLSDLLIFGASSDLVVEEDSSSLLTEADSSSFVADEVSSGLLAEEDSSSQMIREDSSGLVVAKSYSYVAEDDRQVWLPVDDLSGLVAEVASPGLVADDDSYGLLAEEDSYGLVTEEDFYGLVADNSHGAVAADNTYGLVARDYSYGLIAEEGISGAVAEDDSYGVLAEEDIYGLVVGEQSAVVVAEAYYPGMVADQDSYGLLTGEDSFGLLAEEESYAVVLEEASGVQAIEDSYTLLAEDDSYELLTEEDSSGLLLQDNSYSVLAEEDSSSLLANVDVSCLIAKGPSPSLLVGETSDRVALSFPCSDSAKPAVRLEMAPALMEKSIETNIDVTPESQKLNMVPVLGRVIKVMESFYAATEAPYFAGYTVKIKKKDP